MKRALFIQGIAIAMMLSAQTAVAQTSKETVAKKNANGSWTFIKPAGEDVELEVEYFTQEELNEAAGKAISLRSSYTVLGYKPTFNARARALDGGKLSYQWYINDKDSNKDGVPLDGETNSRYTPPSVVGPGTYYYCVVTNDNGVGVGTKTGKVIDPNTSANTPAKKTTRPRSRRRR